MAGVIFEIDPESEDAANANLVIVDNATYCLLDYNDDPSPWDVMTASSADTEGEFVVQNRPTNRTVSIKLRVVGASASALETTLYGLQQKIGKLAREGGTLKKTTPTGDTVVFDVLSNTYAPGGNQFRYIKNQRSEVQLTFLCQPLARGPAVLLADKTETALPVLVFTYPGSDLPGDWSGLGKLVVDEDQGANQLWLIWGVQSRYYDSASSAALFYEAEGRTLLNGSALAAGGGSGAGNNVVRTAALLTTYRPVMSTQATGGGAHLSHVGTFRVFARINRAATDASDVFVALEWGEGDFRSFTRNAPRTIDRGHAGAWVLADLGLVTLTKAPQGTQRWEGRIVAKDAHVDSAGEIIDIDYLMFVPVDEGSGEATAVPRLESPTSVSAQDGFDQAAGAATGKTLPTGGTWSGAGDSTDFAIGSFTSGLSRSADTDTAPGRVLFASTPTLTSTVVQVDYYSHPNLYDDDNTAFGVVARYVDINNFLTAAFSKTQLVVWRRLAGTTDVLAAADLAVGSPTTESPWSIRLAVDTIGRYFAWCVPMGQEFGAPLITGWDSLLANGGTLDDGKVGIYDYNGSGEIAGRVYDNFLAYAPIPDAAIFASQSMELRHDRVIREDSAGAVWQKPSNYEGDYLLVPAAGKEARTVRFIVKASRTDPVIGVDSNIDDISARLTYTPRYLVVPS